MDDSICLDKSPRGVNKLEHVPEKLQGFRTRSCPNPQRRRILALENGAASGFPVPVSLAKRGLLGQ
jgi:hypothetical protein